MRNDLGELSAFAIVAGERSFTRAAARLGVSQSALSHSMRGLEKKLGLQLLARTREAFPPQQPAPHFSELAPARERMSELWLKPESKERVQQAEFDSSSREPLRKW